VEKNSSQIHTYFYLCTAVDSDEETVYFYVHDDAIYSVGVDGTNMKQFVTNGKMISFTCVFRNCNLNWRDLYFHKLLANLLSQYYLLYYRM